MNANFTTTEQSQNFQLIEIRKIKTDFASSNDYMVFRNELMSKAINPWLKDTYHHKDIGSM